MQLPPVAVTEFELLLERLVGKPSAVVVLPSLVHCGGKEEGARIRAKVETQLRLSFSLFLATSALDGDATSSFCSSDEEKDPGAAASCICCCGGNPCDISLSFESSLPMMRLTPVVAEFELSHERSAISPLVGEPSAVVDLPSIVRCGGKEEEARICIAEVETPLRFSLSSFFFPAPALGGDASSSSEGGALLCLRRRLRRGGNSSFFVTSAIGGGATFSFRSSNEEKDPSVVVAVVVSSPCLRRRRRGGSEAQHRPLSPLWSGDDADGTLDDASSRCTLRRGPTSSSSLSA